jgi:hypothetical protein
VQDAHLPERQAERVRRATAGHYGGDGGTNWFDLFGPSLREKREQAAQPIFLAIKKKGGANPN